MYLAVLRSHYEVYAIGETEEEVKRNIVNGYKKCYRSGARTIENPTFDELHDYFGCCIHEIDPQKGYTHE